MLTRGEARRLAVQGQLLAEPRPHSIPEVVDRLRVLQIDVVDVVGRPERLVLWSRLGPYDVGELERLRREGALFEYWVHLVPAEDYAVHRAVMRRRLKGTTARSAYTRDWLTANAAFRRYVMRELRRRGPLRSRDIEDRAAVPWQSGGWNDGKSLGRMLDILSSLGELAVVAREGNERLWDVAERVLPVDQPRLPDGEIARRILDTQLRRAGVARVDHFGWAFDGRPPGWERALRGLVREGVAVPVAVGGLAGQWLAHRDLLDLPFRGRTTFLSPFDRLIQNRKRTEELFGFRYRLEMYVPKAKREFGYYVLPVLHGDELVGRVEPVFDRKENVLRVEGLWLDRGAPRDEVEAALDELAEWLGARREPTRSAASRRRRARVSGTSA